MASMTPLEHYQRDLQDPAFHHDPGQEAVIHSLQALYDRLLEAPEPRRAGALARWVPWVRRPPRWEPVQGLYVWGTVGRGKTYLMDVFHECLPFPEKRRLHFHRFMQLVHQRLRELGNAESPLARIARELADETRVLCFDEFHVGDITDAMLLDGLLRGLFQEGVVLVATSNVPPRELYRDGLQRERFMPAIDRIEACTQVVEIPPGADHRLRFLEQAELYHTPLDAAAEARLAEDFTQLAPEAPTYDTRVTVAGRGIPARGLADDVVWFDFHALCDGPRSQADYIELARCFHSVLISGVPVLDWQHEDQARRFIALVDEFYDRGVKLMLSAAAAVDSLYQGERLVFEFERTRSRLLEMQSRAYLAQPHRP